MWLSRLCRSAVAAAWLSSLAAPLHAQIFENIGTRAQGMGGAFVAVADDATASWWNPAGLASGAYFNGVLEWGRLTEPKDPGSLGPAARATPRSFAAAFPSLGLSYYHLRISEIRPISSIAPGPAGQQDTETSSPAIRSLSFTQFGITVGQSVGESLVVGSTLKLVRHGQASQIGLPSGDPLDAADDLSVPRKTRADLDVGAMAFLGRIRVGVTLKNVGEPNFGTDLEPLRLQRKARAGVALLTPSRGAAHAWGVAFDADLTRTASVLGDVRHVAGGGEAWLANRRLGVRAGAAANTIGDLRPSWSGGLSFAASKGMYLDAAITSGADKTLKAWSTSVRLTL
jgi:hypothetical protein